MFDRTRDQRRLRDYGTRTIWRGCHVDQGDGSRDLLAHSRSCLLNRLRQDLHLELELVPRQIGLVWRDDDEKRRRHLGLVFEVPIENELVAESLKEKEFKTQGRGHQMTSRFGSPAEIRERQDELELEPWSRDILERGWVA